MSVDDPIPRIHLASASPRRLQLLQLGGWLVEARPVHTDEKVQPGETPEAYVRRVALAKAEAAELRDEPRVVLVAADTIVVDADNILGKPADADEARQILLSLRGRTHRVLTALVIRDGESGLEVLDVRESLVPMRRYTANEIEAYIAAGSPHDKAGAYGIQDADFNPVILDALQGCFANIMGLPLCRFSKGMRLLGYEPPRDVTNGCGGHPTYTPCMVPGLLSPAP